MASVTLVGVQRIYPGPPPRVAVDNLDLAIADGEFMVLVGPSGCGKSTTLRMIAGLAPVDAGHLSIGDRLLNDVAPRDRDVAMVFQNYALYPHMTAYRNMAFNLVLKRMSKEEIDNRVKEAASTLRIGHLLERRPRQLSGGEQQRVAMGRALIREPRVFLFDEPLSNLDAKLRVQMRIEIKRLHQRLNATSIFVTHDQIEAMTLADRLVVMNAGRIEQVGAPADVYRRPSTHYVAGFIGSPAMNFFEARVVTPDRVAFGRSAALNLPRNGNLPPAGEAVILGVRPEDIQITHASGDGALPFDIEMIEELGAGRLLYGRLAETDCVVATPSAVAPSPDKVMFARILPESVHIFSAETGSRIDAIN